jgi:hypothetical protein
MPKEPTLSVHAGRNPSKTIQMPRRRQTPSEASKASRELAAASRRDQNAALAAELETYQEQQDAFITKLADSYGRTQEYMRKLVCSGVRYTGTRAPNLKNAIAHEYSRKAREGECLHCNVFAKKLTRFFRGRA